ncbi:ubiquinol oxidase subunit II [Fundidesulfovibrio terrae]|uniref:ubiquinol oxidase subunit II n=1 Tax=Fundidesulfovibrio terrae TaxID=2922866 RepID=UPI001FAFDDF0|nr:ubiquinol oxidase subunit II [Fundidesulfovibrio terrae]
MKRKFSFMFVMLTFLCVIPFLHGCSELVLFNPKGPIGESEKYIILVAFALMLAVVIPVIVMSIWFPLKYKETNTKAPYDPNWSYSKKIEIVMWLVPFVIVLILSTILWRETHRLDPYKPIASEAKPLNVEVVSLDWKWLFIYPEQNIAVVNQFVFPEKIPLSFKITSDTVMTSFFIPQLGSQIYAMAGMQTHLHLMADEQGDYTGQNQQFSGAGFPDMSFKAKATSQEKFDSWVQQVRQSPNKLDFARFDELRKPGVSGSVIFFSSIEPGLFEHIVNKYDPMTRGSYGTGETAHPAHGK